MSREHDPFPVVGIGASAGGLEALRELLRFLPYDTGAAYVVVQHLDPTHESLLSDLLARATPMPVHEAREGMEICANHVYVIAPNTDMRLLQGDLQLVVRTETRGQHLAIDTFLRSLAESCTAGACGVILSGMATDGTLGLQAIKAEGGMTFAQDPTTARFASMPQSAIAAGCVDFVGSPEAIARELTRISRHPYVYQKPVEQASKEQALPEEGFPIGRESEFQQIVRLLSRQTGTDFTAYKPTTLKRRIGRRMALAQIDTFAQYLSYLSDHQGEAEALYQDALIGVTEFFRDTIAFKMLAETILPRLVAEKAARSPLRVWVPGCSTGQEVYSLAICVLEFLAAHSLSTALQLFGTDLNAKAIEEARAGYYPAGAIGGLSPTWLTHFFHQAQGGYQVDKAVRDLCVFAQHDVLKDPPFSRIDLLSCQNMLMYLGGGAQKKVLESFHYALSQEGVLLLGPSESIGSASYLFVPQGEHRRHWYGKQTGRRLPPFSTDVGKARREPLSATREKGNSMESSEMQWEFDLQRETDHLLASFAPASVVVNAQMEILHFRGDTNPYLRPAPGRASLNLLKMARAGLDLDLRTLMTKAKKRGQPVKKAGIPLSDQGVLRDITVEVRPLSASTRERYFVILFAEESTPSIPTTAEAHGTRAARRGSKDRRIEQLERELEITRQEMRAVIEELEVTNEELHSANEEGLSNNEELQSLNEELETSKEELQSSNEELLIVNAELQQRNTQVQQERIFAEAVVETVREPLLILDADLRVQRANRAFYQHFQVDQHETEHHSIFELGDGQWNSADLRTLLKDLLPTNHALVDYEVEHTFPALGHRIMLLNARHIDGVPLILLAIEDITERKQMEAALRESVERLRFMAESMPQKIFTATPTGSVDYVNPQWMEFTGLSFEQIRDWGWTQCLHPEDREETVRSWQDCLESGDPWYGEHRLRRADGVYRWHLSRGIAMRDAQGVITMWIGSNTDITEQKDLERQKEVVLHMATHELKTPLTSLQGNLQLAQRRLLQAQKLLDPAKVDLEKVFGEIDLLLSRARAQLRVQTRLINDLLDVSRLQEHQWDVVLAPCNLVSLVRETVQEAQLAHHERLITMDLPEQAVVEVLADRDRIEQVIQNYLSNAFKYSSREQPVQVGLLRESTTAYVWVADQGPGLSQERHQQIWEPFYRVPGILVQEGGSVNLGVGLTIVQGIMHRHQGQVGVQSEPGSGARFWFRLPLLQEEV